jgi:ubiquinone/menaquinone biosynthesis C-methylase UbiE
MDPVNLHYGRPGLLARVDATLRSLGKDPLQLTPDELAPLDQFHIGGKMATLAIAKASGIEPGDKVLDVGGGLGGPARMLAQETGCRVTVLDLTQEFCEVGRELTARCGLHEKVDFVQGDALAMPFESSSFDVVWSQHSSMNIPGKPKLYSEIARVLKPGGKYVMHEVFAGSTQPVLYPAPWASREDYSFMIPSEEGRALLASAGLREIQWQDTTETGAEWFLARLRAQQATEANFLGINLILGEVFKPAFGNMLKNLQEGRTRIVEAVLVKG